MRFSYKNAAIAVIVFTLILTTILILIAYRTDKVQNTFYTLKDYNGTVALFKDNEIISIYDGVILSTLPLADRQKFSNGIIIKNPDEAESIMEDYDG